MSTQRAIKGAWRQTLRLLLSTLCACVGTPTPEPPDYAPLAAPRDASFTKEIVRVASVDTVDAPIAVVADSNTVASGADVTLINLDDPDVSPVELRANPDGSFKAAVSVRVGQRIRVLYRADGKHSLPLDLEAYGNFNGIALRPAVARNAALDCVRIEPADEITRALREGDRATSVFTIDNRCSEALAITRAELRFGDQGFRLTSPPDSVPASSRAELNVIFPRHTGEGDRSDIVLIDLQRGDQRERHALGVWSIAPSED